MPVVALDPAAALLLRLALGGLLLSAALHKLRAPAAFRAILAEYRLLPPALCGPTAALLLAGELTVGLALIVPAAAPGLAAALAWAEAGLAPVGALALLALYSGAIAANLARGRRHIDCGCAGPAAHPPLGEGLLARNALWMAVAAAALLPVGARPLGALDALTVTAGLAVVASVHAAANRLLASGPAIRALRSTP